MEANSADCVMLGLTSKGEPQPHQEGQCSLSVVVQEWRARAVAMEVGGGPLLTPFLAWPRPPTQETSLIVLVYKNLALALARGLARGRDRVTVRTREPGTSKIHGSAMITKGSRAMTWAALGFPTTVPYKASKITL